MQRLKTYTQNLSSRFCVRIQRKSGTVSNGEKLAGITVVVVSFCLGIWKICNDMRRVLSNISHKNDLWIEIIESIEIFLIISAITAVTMECVVKGRTRLQMTNDVVKYVRQRAAGIYKLVVYVGFYIFLFSILIMQYFLSTNKDYVQLFLSVTGQYYILSTELDFVVAAAETKDTFSGVNQLLTKVLGNTNVDDDVLGSKSSFQLQDFSNIHWKICQYIDRVNHTYSFRLLSIIVCLFYKLMFLPYLLSVYLLKAYSENLMKELMNGCLLLFHFAELLLLAYAADYTNKEAENTKLILGSYLKYESNEKEINEIELFLLNLRVHNAEFKIFNFLKLNKSFVLSIFGSVITYMIIFIQLQDTMNISQILLTN